MIFEPNSNMPRLSGRKITFLYSKKCRCEHKKEEMNNKKMINNEKKTIIKK
ncbi:hypothetical protein Hanom_Chr00s000005g01611261 [Helianthus anomalus]